jgi:hypothetical protein
MLCEELTKRLGGREEQNRLFSVLDRNFIVSRRVAPLQHRLHDKGFSAAH